VKLFFVGMMGSGKTSVGRALAARLGWRFVDLDSEIERAEGRAISAIFAEKGEPAFRALEALAAAGAAAEPGDAVVSLGGGAVMDEGTRRRIREGGRIVWLRGSPAALSARVSGGDRPLLRGVPPEERARRIAELLAARAPFYDEIADFAIETEGRGPAEIAEALASRLLAARVVRADFGSCAYDVLVEPGALGRLGRAMRRAGLSRGRCAAVTDEVVARTPAWETALGALREAGFEPAVAVVEAGEGAKRIAVAERLLEGFAAAGLDRGSPVVAVGGGVVTDLAGFAAAVYARGVPLVLAPTTLLGMVDAAIGGKTGVNLTAGKNLAGAFWQPRLVLCDTDALSTLPPREWTSGLGEVLKYALIGPADLFRLASERLPIRPPGPGAPIEEKVALCDLVARCAAVKVAIVAQDERETSGARKALNFGHTIGHALEAAAGYGTIAHGEAVILGMRAALFLSRRLGLLSAGEEARLGAILDRVPAVRFSAGLADEAILAPLRRDKKFAREKFLFVLLRGQGSPAIDVEVAEEDVLAAIAHLRGGGPPV
jgi:3-dehydroquinate synthase